jgi:lipid-A-disaccharide synthase-like uncharacterized protein
VNEWFDQMLENSKQPIVILGVFGQAVFFMRFLVQWLATEREKRSVIPVAFWYFSIGGALLLLLYGILDHDPVILLGQSTGLFIYMRNLYFIKRNAKAEQVDVTDSGQAADSSND